MSSYDIIKDKTGRLSKADLVCSVCRHRIEYPTCKDIPVIGNMHICKAGYTYYNSINIPYNPSLLNIRKGGYKTWQRKQPVD